MKPVKLGILTALTFFFVLTTYGQNHFEAMNLQAHSNRKVTTIAEKNALRDEGTLPAAAEKNPCASLVVVKAAAMKAGAAVRTGEIQAANVVNQTVGYWKSTSTGIIPIDWNNFSKIQSYLDEKVIEINLDFGPGQKGKISGSVWNQGNTQLQGFGYDDAEIKGVHACFAWDLRSGYGDKALFPFMLRDCNNILGSNLILSYWNGLTKIASGAPDDQAIAGDTYTPDQDDEDVDGGGDDQTDDAEKIKKIIQNTPDGKNVFIIYNSSKSEGSRSSSNNTTNGGAATAPPQIVYLTPGQQQSQQQSSGGGQITWQSNTGATGNGAGQVQEPVTLVNLPQGTGSGAGSSSQTGVACTSCVDALNRKDVALMEADLHGTRINTAISNQNERVLIRNARAQTALLAIGTGVQVADFFGLDNLVQNALHTNATVNVRQIANLQNIASDGQPSDFPNGQNECPAGTTWNGYYCQ